MFLFVLRKSVYKYKYSEMAKFPRFLCSQSSLVLFNMLRYVNVAFMQTCDEGSQPHHSLNMKNTLPVTDILRHLSH